MKQDQRKIWASCFGDGSLDENGQGYLGLNLAEIALRMEGVEINDRSVCLMAAMCWTDYGINIESIFTAALIAREITVDKLRLSCMIKTSHTNPVHSPPKTKEALNVSSRKTRN